MTVLESPARTDLHCKPGPVELQRAPAGLPANTSQARIRMLPSTSRTSYTVSALVAGPLITAPVVMELPWWMRSSGSPSNKGSVSRAMPFCRTAHPTGKDRAPLSRARFPHTRGSVREYDGRKQQEVVGRAEPPRVARWVTWMARHRSPALPSRHGCGRDGVALRWHGRERQQPVEPVDPDRRPGARRVRPGPRASVRADRHSVHRRQRDARLLLDPRVKLLRDRCERNGNHLVSVRRRSWTP